MKSLLLFSSPAFRRTLNGSFTAFIFLLSLAAAMPVGAANEVRIPVQQCHLWAMNAATVVQHKNDKMSEKELIAFFNKLVVEQGGNVKSSEAEAVRELIRRIYRHKPGPSGQGITVAEAYDRTMKECVVNEGVILQQGQARTSALVRTESRAGS